MNTNSRPLTLETLPTAKGAVVYLRGGATVTHAEMLRVELETIIARKLPLLVLDLSDLDFICSLGLGALVTAHARSRHHEGQVRIVNPQPAVRNLLETTRLNKILPIFPDLAQAMAG